MTPPSWYTDTRSICPCVRCYSDDSFMWDDINEPSPSAEADPSVSEYHNGKTLVASQVGLTKTYNYPVLIYHASAPIEKSISDLSHT